MHDNVTFMWQVTGAAVFSTTVSSNKVLTVASTAVAYSGDVVSATLPISSAGNLLLLLNSNTKLMNVRPTAACTAPVVMSFVFACSDTKT